MTAGPQPGPLIVGGVVVLHGDSLALVADALSFQTAHLWRAGGLRPSRRQQQLHEAVRQAMSAMSATGGREDIIPAPTAQDSYMDTTELASALHCSVRHARRIADGLDPIFNGRDKLVPRAAVTEHLKGRRHAAY
jgi:hypothetical protein